jgi:hypothetical protein
MWPAQRLNEASTQWVANEMVRAGLVTTQPRPPDRWLSHKGRLMGRLKCDELNQTVWRKQEFAPLTVGSDQYGKRVFKMSMRSH